MAAGVEAEGSLSIGGLRRVESRTVPDRRQSRQDQPALLDQVSSLERVRFGPLTLGALPEGESRALGAAEVAELYAAAGWDDPAP